MKKILLTTILLSAATLSPTEIDDIQVFTEMERKITCLAKNIYFEARGESKRGMLAVAHVTMNRKQSSRYPSTICAVVYQKHQFSWVANKPKIRDKSAYQIAKSIAHDVIMGYTSDPTKGALHFHSVNVSPGWNLQPRVKIGNHIFY
jgi:N-acetylmuramoyl-L-alanine amidase